MNLEQQRAKAERYMLWAKEDGLSDAIETIKQGYMKAIETSRPEDTAGRERCYIAMGIVNKIESHIQGVIGGGKVAQAKLKLVEQEELSRNKLFNIL